MKHEKKKIYSWHDGFRTPIIDDLLAVNDDSEFERSFLEIYPPEMQLNKEHGRSNVSFLDLNISVVDRQLTMKLFDKRDDFPFSIIRMPFAASIMPSTMFYSLVRAEIFRISRVSSTSNDFNHSSKVLIVRVC